MAKFFQHNAAVGLRKSEAEEGRFPIPSGATDIVEFDEVANAQVIADFDTGFSRFSYSGGAVHRDGSPVAFDPPSTLTTQLKATMAGGIRLNQDRSTTSVNYQNVVGLEFQLEANAHYAFQFDGAYSTAANTTGIQLALNGPAFSFFAAGFEIATSLTAWLSAMSAAYDNGVNGTGSAGATALPFHIFGNISTTEAGLLIVRGRSEVNGSQVTIRRGSYGLLTKVG